MEVPIFSCHAPIDHLVLSLVCLPFEPGCFCCWISHDGGACVRQSSGCWDERCFLLAIFMAWQVLLILFYRELSQVPLLFQQGLEETGLLAHCQPTLFFWLYAFIIKYCIVSFEICKIGLNSHSESCVSVLALSKTSPNSRVVLYPYS